jgi:hypothetical protein
MRFAVVVWLRMSGRRSAQLSLCLEVRDETTPPAYRVLLRGCRHGQQADGAIAQDPVAMLDAARQEDEPTIVKLKRVISAAEHEIALQHVEDLVFRRVGMVRRFLTSTSGVLDERQAPPFPSSPALTVKSMP